MVTFFYIELIYSELIGNLIASSGKSTNASILNHYSSNSFMNHLLNPRPDFVLGTKDIEGVKTYQGNDVWKNPDSGNLHCVHNIEGFSPAAYF